MGNSNHYRIPGPNKTLYEGQCDEQGRPHGSGSMKYADGSTFVGKFQQGMPTNGKFQYDNKNSYTGAISDLRPEGQGLMQTPQAHFIGQFKQGKFIKGQIKYSNGDHYKGYMQNGKKHGDNTEFHYKNGDTYIGSFYNDQFEKGVYESKSDNSRYQGSFVNSLMECDNAKLIVNNKFQYQGAFKGDKFNGQGDLKNLQTRTQYKGTFLQGKKQGKGIIIDQKNNTHYDGEFVNNMKHGYGVYKFGNRKYEGCFQFNKFNGKGKLIHSSGDIYEGQFKNNQKHGRGKYILTSMRQYQYYDGQFVNDMFHGQGQLMYTNGDKYIGLFEENKKNGRGTYYRGENGQVLKGQWKKDKKQGEFLIIQQKQNRQEITGSFTNDQRNGIFISKNKDGQQLQQKWINGKKIYA